MDKITVTVNMFGIFRDYFPNNNYIKINIDKSSTLIDIRNEIKYILSKIDITIIDLVDASAFATDIETIDENFIFNIDTTISILPPVSGG